MALANPIDDNAQGLIGKPVDRVDGPLKVSGEAPYAYEYRLPGESAAYGVIVGSAIAKGKIKEIDTSDAEAASGVALVMTYKNAPKQGEGSKHDSPLNRAKPYLDSKDIHYYDEPVALVVAESFEEARHAAHLVKVTYDADPALKLDFARLKGEAYKPKHLGQGQETDSKVGDPEGAFASAPVKIDVTYTTPPHHSMPIELHSALAVWSGKKLTIHSAHQLPMSALDSLAQTLKIGKDDIRVLCKYVGGGFGSKLDTQAEAILAALSSRQLQRPVKVAMTRQQVFFGATHRAESMQRVRLGATADGTLTTIAHEAWLQTSPTQEYIESAALQTRSLYAAPNRLTTHRLIELDLPPSGSVRAPGEAIGMLAIEQAMDELAYALTLDPVELRLRNEPAEDPEKKIPFSSRKLTECLKQGAERFGWDKRPAKPGSLRDGRWRVGYGVASAYRSNLLQSSQARVTLDASGKLKAELAMTDIGTGSYTILTQIAAETMQLPMQDVTVVIGDSSLPETPGSGGSWGANSAGSGLYDACMNLRKQLAEAAVKDTASPLHGRKTDEATFIKGRIVIGDAFESYASLAARAEPKTLIANGEIDELKTYKEFSQAAYGAYFVEVGVDEATGEVRLRRMLGVFAAGRILNPKTARSQAIGGMIWGLGAALLEGSVVDTRYGQFVNHDLAEYHLPVHADAVNIDAIYLPEIDDKTGPLKIKGVGELGICGSGAAVANAVYNACGVRVRDYPITLDKIIKEMA